jgi:hypothetical protein
MIRTALVDGEIVELSTEDSATLAPSLAKAKAARIRDVQARAVAAYAEGVAYGGKRFAATENRTNVVAAVYMSAKLDDELPNNAASVPFQATDGTVVLMDIDAIRGAGQDAGFARIYRDFVASVQGTALAHEMSISALETVAAVQAYDIETGWPS